MSFSGDFSKLNVGAPSVKITGLNNLFFSFDEAVFDGKMTTVNVPFNEKIFQKPFVVEILGDWTRGVETVAIDNVEFYY